MSVIAISDVDKVARELYEIFTRAYSPSVRVDGIWARANKGTRSRYRKAARYVLRGNLENRRLGIERLRDQFHHDSRGGIDEVAERLDQEIFRKIQEIPV